MKHKNMRMALLGLLTILGNPADAQENKAVVEMLPLCVDHHPSIRVLAGDSLLNLSQRMPKPDEISNSEWIDLVYEKNRDVFIDNDRNRISAGEVLLFPCSEVSSGSEKQPGTTEALGVADLVSTVREMKTELSQIKRLVEAQPEAPSTQAQRPDLFATAVLWLAGSILLLLGVLSVCLYRWNRVLSATASQTLPVLEKVKQILPAISTIVERAEGRVLKPAADDGAVERATDETVLRDYLKRLVPVDLAIEDFMRDDGAESKALKVIKALAEDALASCGVETFAPEIGEDYRRAEGVADYPKTRVTDKPEDKFKIVEVLEKGYRIKTPKGYDVIYPARVRIFTTN